MRFTAVVFPMLAAIAIAKPVSACDTTPDLVHLPGETDEAFESRLEKTESDQWVIKSFQRETRSFEKASSVYVARVTESYRPSGGALQQSMPWAKVQPLHSIKGPLPSEVQRLAITGSSSCYSFGDGDAAGSSVGTIVFVFEGLPKSNVTPNGIDSFPVREARTFELLEPLAKYANEHPFNQ